MIMTYYVLKHNAYMSVEHVTILDAHKEFRFIIALVRVGVFVARRLIMLIRMLLNILDVCM